MAKAVGIDLGTTNSVVAVMEGGKRTVIINSDGGRCPSIADDPAVETRPRSESGRDRHDSGFAGPTPCSRARESVVACAAIRSASGL